MNEKSNRANTTERNSRKPQTWVAMVLKIMNNTWLCISDIWLKENGTCRTDAYILLNLDKYLPSPSDGLDPRLLLILNNRKLCYVRIYIADLCICLMNKSMNMGFWSQDVGSVKQTSESDVIKQQNMKLLITLIDLTANALTQKSSSFLPITLFKLNQK